MTARAAVLLAHGGPPVVQERPAPEAGPGQVLVEVHAAPITPLDVLCASGTSYFGAPALPYVPGVQGVGVVVGGSAHATGTPVWFATSAGMAPGDGSLATVVAVAEHDVVAIEPDVPPTAVASLGLSAVAAWMSPTRHPANRARSSRTPSSPQRSSRQPRNVAPTAEPTVRSRPPRSTAS